MRAIILNAGQGRRLLPLTADRPKCLLTLHSRTILAWQLHALAAVGVEEAVVVVGFGAAQVEAELRKHRPAGMRVHTVHNPLFDRTDNLVSCQAARSMMRQDFLLLNGDTLFQPGVVARLLDSKDNGVSIAVSCKETYDDDDMKVEWRNGRVSRIGKDLPADGTDGEAIGLSLFRGAAPECFLEALDEIASRPGGQLRWYLSAIDLLAKRGLVHGVGTEGLSWIEIDTSQDLADARDLMPEWSVVSHLGPDPVPAGLVESIEPLGS